MKKELNVKIVNAKVDAPFDNRLFGIFIESIGNCIYGGLLKDKESSLPDLDGMRLDILDALKKLNVGVVRVPGGDYADNYHWQDGIGKKEERPVHYNGNWKMNDPNHFGTHEFIKLCDYIGAKPQFVANLGTGSVEEARAWVEYCNHPSGTKYSDLRIKNGSEKPFGVKYWAVGNEPFNRGGLMEPEYYAYLYRNYAYFMKLMDPKIELIMGGSYTQPSDFNERALKIICNDWRPPVPEHLSLHAYTSGVQNKNYSKEEYYSVLRDIEDYNKRIDSHIELCKKYSKNGTKIRLSIDEYAAWHAEATDPLLQMSVTMLDALAAARVLQYTAYKGDAVSMLCASVTINALLSLILTKGDLMSLTPAYYAYLLMSEHLNGEIYKLEAEFLDECKNGVPLISTLATKNGNKTVISIVNADFENDIDVILSIEAGKVKAKILKLTASDVHDENLPGEKEKICPYEQNIINPESKLKLTAEKHSITVISIE